MRLAVVLLACALLLTCEPVPEPASVVCEWPEECAYGWAVVWTYNGIVTASLHETPEQAMRLYAVLARQMTGGAR